MEQVLYLCASHFLNTGNKVNGTWKVVRSFFKGKSESRGLGTMCIVVYLAFPELSQICSEVEGLLGCQITENFEEGVYMQRSNMAFNCTKYI